MTWEQKLEALMSLTETTLVMREPGDWYVEAPGRHIGGDGMLYGKYGNGRTPQEAVENDWEIYSEVKYPMYVVIENHKGRNHYVWTGYMWKKV